MWNRGNLGGRHIRDGMYGAAPVDLGWRTRKGKIVVIDRNGSQILDFPTKSQGVGVAISDNGIVDCWCIDDYNLYSFFRETEHPL